LAAMVFFHLHVYIGRNVGDVLSGSTSTLRKSFHGKLVHMVRTGSLTVTVGVTLQAPCFLVASAVLTVTFTSKMAEFSSSMSLLFARSHVFPEGAAFLRCLGAGAESNG
jgi:hypothetical protein